MKRVATVLAASGLLWFFLTAIALADEVFLKNGNHLSGTIISMGEGKLILETGFAGRLTIDWASVERLSTDAPLTVVLEKQGATLKGIPRPSAAPNQLVLNGGSIQDPLMIELSRVKAINPPDEQPIQLHGRVNGGSTRRAATPT